MKYQFLTCEIDERGVAEVCLNRPEIHNAFNEVLIEELRKVFEELEGEESCRLAVITGSGKSFCAGADLNWMKSMVDYTREENYADSKKLSEMFASINSFSKPLIGKVNGHALGGGVGLVCVCDYVLANERSKFGFTETRLGIIPAVISPYCISKIGESNARAWFLSGEVFDCDKALKMNLIHELAEQGELDSRCSELVESFLKAGPEAAKEAKLLIKKVKELSKEEAQEYSLKAITRLRVSEEGQAGMKALLNKTKPYWVQQ